MKIKQTQKPLMVAYIIFLCACCIYYIISGVFELEFPVWQRIVVAATIASYFFSLCSVPKFTAKMGKRNLEYLSNQNALYKKILAKDEILIARGVVKAKCADLVNAQLNRNAKDVVKDQKDVARMEKEAFWLDVFGFLVFFFIMTFDSIYSHFSKLQEFHTLLAFAIVLIVEYWESTKLVYFEELCRESTNGLRELLTSLEEKENGKVEDALCE